MIIRLINKKSVLICAAVSFISGVFIFLSRYTFGYEDPLYNNFLYIHDGDLTDLDFHLLLSVLNIVLLFPFATELLTYHKSTNEIYIVSRMSNSARFYYIKFSQLALLCFAQSTVYNSSILTAYCLLGHPAESRSSLAGMFLYAVAVSFFVSLVFVSFLQLLETLINAKTALILVIIIFCLSVLSGFKLPKEIAQYWPSNVYFITPFFASKATLSLSFSVSACAAFLIPIAITAAITAAGSMIYKRKDHI